MLIHRKTTALAVRHVFNPEVLGITVEVVARDGLKVAGRIVEEAAGKIAGDWARENAAEKLPGAFLRP